MHKTVWQVVVVQAWIKAAVAPCPLVFPIKWDEMTQPGQVVDFPDDYERQIACSSYQVQILSMGIACWDALVDARPSQTC